MGQNSNIEWTDHTANFWWGCTEVSPGCDHCYARSWDKRHGGENWGVHAPRRIIKGVWDELAKWERQAKASGVRARVFVSSMMDIGEILPADHPQNEEINALRRRFFDQVVPDCPHLDFQLLTKRIGNIPKVVPPDWLDGLWPSNVWQLITVVNQQEADRDIPKLLKVPAPIIGLSVEPMLGPVRLPDEFLARGERAWVISGGESGSKARPMHPAWALSLRDQCQANGVPFLFKQWGEWLPWLCFNDTGIKDSELQTRFKTVIWDTDEGRFEDIGNPQWFTVNDDWGGGAAALAEPDQVMGLVGKKAAGRLLDGRTWDEFPEAAESPTGRAA